MTELSSIISGMAIIISTSALIYAWRSAQACENIAYWIEENITVLKVDEEEETE